MVASQPLAPQGAPWVQGPLAQQLPVPARPQSPERHASPSVQGPTLYLGAQIPESSTQKYGKKQPASLQSVTHWVAAALHPRPSGHAAVLGWQTPLGSQACVVPTPSLQESVPQLAPDG